MEFDKLNATRLLTYLNNNIIKYYAHNNMEFVNNVNGFFE